MRLHRKRAANVGPQSRRRYDRSGLRYESDLSDEEWALIGPLIPPGIPPAKRGGDRRHVNIREVGNGVMYVLSAGRQWRAVPKDLPPRSTVHGDLVRWIDDRTLQRTHHALCVQCREQAVLNPLQSQAA